MKLRPPTYSRTYKLFPDTTRVRSVAAERQAVQRSQASSRAEFRRRGSEKAARHLAGGDEVLVERRRDAEAGQALHARGAEGAGVGEDDGDRKSTRLNSSH